MSEEIGAGGELPQITKERLIEALMKLRPFQREVFLMATKDQLSYAEIGKRAGISVSRVERILAKALVNIDRMMCAFEEHDRSG